MKKVLAVLLSLTVAFYITLPAFAVDKSLPFKNSKFFIDGDYTLHYRIYDSEKENGQIMLLHGFGLSTVSLEGIAEQYFAKGYDVVTVDMPNFGYSSRETVKTELKSREELTYDLMSELGGEWILGGHSMGGGIAANVAIEHSDIVKALVLFAPQTSAQAGSMNGLLRKTLFTNLFNIIIKYGIKIPGVMKALVALSFSEGTYACNYDTERIRAPLSIEGTGGGILIMSSHTNGTDIESFSALEIPICIITSSNDKIANKSNLNALVNSAAPKLEVHEVSSGGHMMMEYDPAGVAELTMAAISAA